VKKFSEFFIGLPLLGMIVFPVFAVESSKFDFKNEIPGTDSKAFNAIVGTWHIDKDGPHVVYAVDGRRLQAGLSPGAAEHAKKMFGEKSAEFLKGIQPLKDFPLTISKEYPDFKNGILTVSFKAISGKEDQAAGLAFNIKQTGEYLAIRANALENNLVLFKFEKGKRSPLQWIDRVSPPTAGWHMLKVIIKGMKIEGFLDDKKYIDYEHGEPISGRIGLWSKADSYVLFDKFMVEPK
jgi:hypothetical protein